MSLIHTGALSLVICVPVFLLSTISCAGPDDPSIGDDSAPDAGASPGHPVPISNSEDQDPSATDPDAAGESSSAYSRRHPRADAGSGGGGHPDASAPGATPPVVPPPPSGGSAGGPTLGGCQIYPAGSPWNTDVSKARLNPTKYSLDPSRSLHADWGTPAEGYGIPWNVGKGNTPVTVDMTAYPDESDVVKGSCNSNFCYPLPSNAKIESPGDSHLLFLDTGGAPSHCMLYELWQASPAGNGYSASCGAVFHLDGTSPRPQGWTSADAAGLAILPGLVKYQEVKSGRITHAFRFTMQATSNGYVAPAFHAAATGGSSAPPMGTRVRLRAGFAVGSYSKEAQTVLVAMQTYGMILADNGSNWYVSGDQDSGWAQPASDGDGVRDSIQSAMRHVTGADFEVLDSGSITSGN